MVWLSLLGSSGSGGGGEGIWQAVESLEYVMTFPRQRRVLFGFDVDDIPDAEDLARDEAEDRKQIDQERAARALAVLPKQRSEK